MHLLLPTAFTLSPLVGWWIGAPWLTLVLAAIAIPAAEWFWGGYASTAPSYRWGVWLPRVIMLSVLIMTGSLAINAAHYEWDALVWLALSSGYVCGGIGIVLAHELGHRRALLDRSLARTLLTWVAFGHYVLEHNRGHHRHAATLHDPASARQNESVWRFMPRYFLGIYRDSLKLSREQPGKINETLTLTTLTFLLFALVMLAAGLKGLMFCVIQACLAKTLVATIDYVEHWGLQRRQIDGKHERMNASHIWDCANRVSDALLFNLPRHASHHLEPSLNCDQLYPIPESPQMPTGYAGMVLLAWIPSLYVKIMTPRLPAPHNNTY
jgi:alkane 1-monooxygenase